MSILSITFHTPENLFAKWEIFQEQSLLEIVENYKNVEKYVISEVESELLTEGTNTNLFLIFNNKALKNDFLENDLTKISTLIEAHFGEEVMMFVTHLNTKKSRL